MLYITHKIGRKKGMQLIFLLKEQMVGEEGGMCTI